MPAGEIFVLSWEVRNANDFEGEWLFATEELAIMQAAAWLADSDLSTSEVAERIENLRDEGICEGPRDGDWYAVTGQRVRSEIETA
jgi:hypothetical protein